MQHRVVFDFEFKPTRHRPIRVKLMFEHCLKSEKKANVHKNKVSKNSIYSHERKEEEESPKMAPLGPGRSG